MAPSIRVMASTLIVASAATVAAAWLQIEATLERVPCGMTSGWSSWEDGMSDRARDVTH
jgi:hypothetical protein